MNSRNRFPFTASQWQELEQQALIYKYMASGIRIPPDLLFSVRRSYLDSPLSARFLSYQPQHVGWNYLQMSSGRKIDPEPGRCRRTDGKKWRCSKEAFPDSKYCEKHMHRGKNRSRKPVEALKVTPTNTNTSTPQINKYHPSAALTPIMHSASAFSSSLSSDHRPQQHSLHHPFLYHSTNNNNSSTNASSRPSGNAIGLSFQGNNAPSSLDSGTSYSQSNADYRNRYLYGLKEEVDEHVFFSEPSGTMKSLSASSVYDSWQLTPLKMSSSSSSKQRSCSGILQDYSYLQLQSLGDSTKQQDQNQDQDQRSCYGVNSDIKRDIPMRLGNDEPQKTIMHHFLDEWPHKGRDSWLDLDDKTSNASSASTTRLSISIPTSHHDFRTN